MQASFFRADVRERFAAELFLKDTIEITNDA